MGDQANENTDPYLHIITGDSVSSKQGTGEVYTSIGEG